MQLGKKLMLKIVFVMYVFISRLVYSSNVYQVWCLRSFYNTNDISDCLENFQDTLCFCQIIDVTEAPSLKYYKKKTLSMT